MCSKEREKLKELNFLHMSLFPDCGLYVQGPHRGDVGKEPRILPTRAGISFGMVSCKYLTLCAWGLTEICQGNVSMCLPSFFFHHMARIASLTK